MRTTLRIASGFRNGAGVENAGEFFVSPDEWPNSMKVRNIQSLLKHFQEIEPDRGWHLETRGELTDWHPVL